jgi:hypothetical protein
LKTWKRGQNDGNGDGGLLFLIISPPISLFLFLSNVPIWFSIVHHYLCQISILILLYNMDVRRHNNMCFSCRHRWLG